MAFRYFRMRIGSQIAKSQAGAEIVGGVLLAGENSMSIWRPVTGRFRRELTEDWF